MATATPRALVFGHSFVRRVGDFIDEYQHSDLYRRDLHLAGSCVVQISGIGGRTVDKTIRFDLEMLRSTAPNILVLEMGSNDLCDSDHNPEAIAELIVALTDLLLSMCHIQFIVVCQILPSTLRGIQRAGTRSQQLSERSAAARETQSSGNIVASSYLWLMSIWAMGYT